MNSNDFTQTTKTHQQDNPQGFEAQKRTIKDTARAVKDTAQQWQRQATEATRKAAQATDVYVHENPWAIIGYVALGCFTIGFLLGRSRD